MLLLDRVELKRTNKEACVTTQPRHFHLAQLNLARLRFDRDAPELQSYRAALADVMPVAEDWPGFLWIRDDSIIDRSVGLFGPRMAANLSLWRDIEALEAFMTCARHAAVMERRGEWFDETPEPTFVLWWVPANHRPGMSEAHERLALLRRQGPGPEAFDLTARFPPPSP